MGATITTKPELAGEDLGIRQTKELREFFGDDHLAALEFGLAIIQMGTILHGVRRSSRKLLLKQLIELEEVLSNA